MSHKPPGSRKRKPAAKPKPKVIPLLERPVAPVAFRPVLLQRVRGERPNQLAYLRSMAQNVVTFGLGSSGTGKSFMAAGFAAAELHSGRASRVILSRPLVQCGNGIGFLPGDLHAKVSPFMLPLLESLEAFFSKADIEKMIELDKLRITPLELMRGSSPKDTILICDEAQNASRAQLEMILTRVDVGSRLIFTGDQRQADNGLSPIVETVRQLCTPEMLDSMAVIRFTKADNMRSPFVAAVCERLGI